jgi:tRNA pseudouridine38-40 synthase
MFSYRVDFAYDGTDFKGYAIQREQRTVQGEIEAALSRIGGEIKTVVAGRTDAGVHAHHQVLNVKTERELDGEGALQALNTMLKADISVRSVSPVPEDFSARFSAIGRTYRYFIKDGGWSDPFERRRNWVLKERLALPPMLEAANYFVGDIDFSSFCKPTDGRSPVRSVRRAEWERTETHTVLEVEAASFCQQMIRSIVRWMVDIGRGEIDPSDTPVVLAKRDRRASRGAAPPQGLFLWKVDYPNL